MAIIEGVRNGKYRITVPINTTRKLFTPLELLLTVDDMETVVKTYRSCEEYLKPFIKGRKVP